MESKIQSFVKLVLPGIKKIGLMLLGIVLFVGYFSIPKTIKEDGLERKSDVFLYNEDNIDKVFNSTVALVGESEIDGSLEVFCSGFFISPVRIITAKHCLFSDGKDLVNVDSEDLDEHIIHIMILDRPSFANKNYELSNIRLSDLKSARLIRMNAVTNLEFVDYSKDHLMFELDNVNNPNKTWLPVARNNLKVGDSVYSVGMPLQFPWVFVSGRLSQFLNFKDVDRFIESPTPNQDLVPNSYLELRKFYLVNLDIWPGASGGPIINNRGEVVGVVSMVIYADKIGGGLLVTPDTRSLKSFISYSEEVDDFGFIHKWFRKNLKISNN